MTLDSFGSRLGISRQAAQLLERSEAKESISIKRLRAAAEAIDCELVLYLRPRRKLQATVREQAQIAAREIVGRAGHSMAMEDQAVTAEYAKKLIEETADELINRGDSSIWQWK